MAFPTTKVRQSSSRSKLPTFLPSISYVSFLYLFVALGGLLFWSRRGSPMVDPVQLTADTITHRLQVYSALKGTRFVPAHDPSIEVEDVHAK